MTTISKSEPVVLGVDLGGTKILAAVITKSGVILGRAKKKTKAQRDSGEILDRILECCTEAVSASGVQMDQIQAIGVGSPGPLDPVKGIVLHTPNLNLANTPIAPYLSEKLGKPAFLDNDVNVGTLGEHVYGAGKGKKTLLGMFIGTGIGGGIILDGKLFHGKSYNAGEFGHIKVRANGARCGCGQKGCLEAYASKTALAKRFKRAIKKGKLTILPDLIRNDWSKMGSNVLLKAYDEHDELVVREIHRAAGYIGIAIGSLINIFSPEMIVIGGGVMQAFGHKMMNLIKTHTAENCFTTIYETVEIVPAVLGDDSGILGAAALAWQKSS